MTDQRTLKKIINEQRDEIKSLQATYQALYDFSEWLEVRLREHEILHHIFAASECYAIQQKFDEVFFTVKASERVKQ